MSFENGYLYKFKDFHLDLDETALLRDGKQVPITPKAFHLLRILVENHGSVVKKDKLISQIWEDSFVEEGNLAFTARMLRKVLDDDAKHPIFIETVPRKGYRFIADVSKDPDPAAAEPIEDVPEQIPASSGFLLWGVALFVIVAAILTAGLYVFRQHSASTSSAPILSLPFKAERLSSTGNATHAVISPNSKFVAYTDQSNGKWSLWLRLLETAENIQVVPPADVFYGGLVFSRDGNYLFFARAEKGTKELNIYRVNTFGGIPAKLIASTQGWMSISPDDKQISFVRCEYTPNDYCSLFIADVDGKNERRILTRAEPIRIADNQFSPDGQSIAFAAGQSRTGSNEFELFRVDLYTGGESEITPHKFFNIKSLKWLPDGTGLLLTAREQFAHKFSIWKVDAAAGSSTQLTSDDANFSGLSLDEAGSSLVATKVDNDFAVYLESVKDRASQKLLASGSSAVFTADGKIVYESADRDIWIIDADGSNKRQLTSGASTDICPNVSSDGRFIFFSSNRSGVNHIWRMNIDGSDQKQITRIEGGYARFVTPDGKWVYYKAGINDSFRRVASDGSDEAAVPEIEKYAPAFSPDGRLLAYFVRDAAESGGRPRIGIRNLSDQSLARLIDVVDDKADLINLQWSTDSRSLFYLIKLANNYSLFHQSLESNKADLAANLGSDPIGRITIGPDGLSIAAVRGGWTHDAFLITGLKH